MDLAAMMKTIGQNFAGINQAITSGDFESAKARSIRAREQGSARAGSGGGGGKTGGGVPCIGGGIECEQDPGVRGAAGTQSSVDQAISGRDQPSQAPVTTPFFSSSTYTASAWLQ